MEVSKELLYYGLWWTIYAYIGVVNVFAMIATANDKVKAVYDLWRIAEAELFFSRANRRGTGHSHRHDPLLAQGEESELLVLLYCLLGSLRCGVWFSHCLSSRKFRRRVL